MDWAAAIPGYLGSMAARSLALAAAAGIALALLRVKSAAARHACWTAVSAGILVLAALEPIVPPLPWRILRAPAEAPRIEPAVDALPLPVVLPLYSAPAMPKPRAWRPTWQECEAAVYLGGVLLLLGRLAASYRFTRSLAAAGRQVDGNVYASSWIAVPVTLGFLRPIILLPEEWNQWPADKLAAVMTHERAHVRRADWAIVLLAEVNRCLLWFHPLTWWLVHQLAALAEQAADDAALLTLDSRESYARTLLEMAATVKSSRGRIVWEAIAMAKTAEVRSRIERILDETRRIPRGLTRAHWAMLVAASVPLIYLAATVQVARAQTARRLPLFVPPLAIAAAPPPVMLPDPPAVSQTATAQPAIAAQTSEPTPNLMLTTSASAEYPYHYVVNFRPVTILRKVIPVYPTEAIAAGVAGDAELQLVIGTDGRVNSAVALAGNPVLTAAAQQAVSQWIFQPIIVHGEVAEQETTVTLHFRLPPDTDTPSVSASPEPQGVHLTAPPGSPMPIPIALPGMSPEYPLGERAAGVQGTVVLSMKLDTEGHFDDIQVVNSVSPLLDQSAIDAIRKWKLALQRRDGEPAEQPMTARVNFRLVSPPMLAHAAIPPDSKPAIIEKVEPILPEAARAAGRRGTVMLSVLVGADGQIRNMKVTHSPGYGMDQAAVEALQQWKFKPAMQNGLPVDYRAMIEINFR